MTDVLLRLLLNVTLGLALVLALRHPARRLFGAGPAFALWLLPLVLAAAPLLPRRLAASAVAVRLPVIAVTPHVDAIAHAGAAFNWALLLVVLWAVGAALACGRLAWRYARLRARVRRGSVRWTAGVADAAPDVDVRRLRAHADGPAVLAAWPRSLLLLPADFAQRFGNAVTRELVLRHELTHLRRGDAWWSLAMEVALALLWLHPLAWLSRPCFRLDQELACDAAALRGAPQHTARYARALLDSVAVRPVPALIPWLAEPQLKARIAMLARRVPGTLRRRVGALAIVVLLGGGALALSGQAAVPTAPATRANAAAPLLIMMASHAASAPPATRANAAAPLLIMMASHAASTPPATSVPVSVDVSYKNRNPPRYPVAAARKGEQGMVILKVTINAAGAVSGLAVDPHGTTAPPVLQAAAVRAAGGWKFNPGSKGGKAVGGVVTIPVNFSLQGMDGKPYKPRCSAGNQYVQQIKQCVKLVQPGSSAR